MNFLTIPKQGVPEQDFGGCSSKKNVSLHVFKSHQNSIRMHGP
jgi:hypothetical protein